MLIEESTEILYQDCCLKAQQHHSREVENMQEQQNQTKSFHDKLVNEKVTEVEKLKNELQETNLKLQKATKIAGQRARSWINKKNPAMQQSCPTGCRHIDICTY